MEENQNAPLTSSAPDSVSPPRNVKIPGSSPPHPRQNSGEHSFVSPPQGSPAGSYSSPLDSKQSSGGHISLSPQVSLGSLGNSPACLSPASDHITINPSRGPSPQNEKPPSVKNEKPPSPETGKLPLALVSRDVFTEPMENRVVLEDPAVVGNGVALEETKEVVAKTDTGGAVVEGGRRRFRSSLSILKRTKREKVVTRATLGFRVLGSLCCLVSVSVMAADRNQGWALDSFYRYKEFRYCMSVNAMGFLYSGAQAVDSSYNMATGKYTAHHQQQLRRYFDFAIDQCIGGLILVSALWNKMWNGITKGPSVSGTTFFGLLSVLFLPLIIAYLLISASSSAAIRVDDWQSNWGKDSFPHIATASMSMSFLAFVALACSSLISGYALCTSKSL